MYLLKKGITNVGELKAINGAEILRVAKASLASPQILAGVFFEGLFFLCLLLLMSRSDISLLWPLTGLSFVFSTFAAIWFLNERVSTLRWWGVVLIVAGAVLISYSEQRPEKAHAPGAPSPSNATRS